MANNQYYIFWVILLQFAVEVVGSGYGLLIASSAGKRFFFFLLSKWVDYLDWFTVEVVIIDFSLPSIDNDRQFVSEGSSDCVHSPVNTYRQYPVCGVSSPRCTPRR